MKWKRDWENKKWVPLTIAICIGVVLFLFLSNMPTVFGYIGRFLNFFRPAFLGLVFAYVLDPLMRLFEFHVFKSKFRPRTRHFVSLACSAVIVVLALFLLGLFLIPQLVSSVSMFIQNLDSYSASAGSALAKITEYFSEHGIDITGFMENVEEMFSSLKNLLPTGVDGLFSLIGNIGSNVLDVLIAAILALYFLADKERLMHGMSSILKAVVNQQNYAKVTEFLLRGHHILIRYILYDLLEALFVGLANFFFMLIAGLPYGVLISAVVAITNLAPTFGPIAGGAIGAFLLFLVKPMYAVQFLIFTVALQIFDGYVLKPRMFSGALGVPGVAIIICIVVGGKMFGIWGILLAIPFATIAYYVIRESVLKKLEQKKAAEAAAETEVT